MPNDYTILNYYDDLTEKQKEKLKEKKSLIIYYDYFEEFERLTYKKRGILISALIFYGKTHGTEPLPSDLDNELKKDRLLCYMFETLQKREKKATLEWVNRRGSKVKEKIKSKIIETDDEDGCELFGNVENMPDSYVDVQLSGGDLQDFLSFGNFKKWNKPYMDLLSEWNASIDPTNIFDEDSEPF